MHTKKIKALVRHTALGGFFIGTLALGWSPQLAFAAAADAKFVQYIQSICATQVVPPGWDVVTLTTMCNRVNTGGPAGGPVPAASVSSNLGTANASSGAASRKKKRVQDLTEEEKKAPEKSASADNGGWGLLVSPQYSKNSRAQTDFENGYQSTLSGLVIGLDYRYSDKLVVGGTIGQTNDNATFLNGAGSLKTGNNSFTLYSTWLPSEKVSVDGYLGYGKITIASHRFLSYGSLISGMVNGDTTGNQLMGGMSTSYQADMGRFNVSPFLNLDYIKTSFKGYSETGTTTMELRYKDRNAISFTSSLGGRVNTSYGYDWGTLTPSMRLAAVHEFQNNAHQLSNELVSTPGTGFQVATDAPDRNYLISGLGVAGALHDGTQLFFDFEKRSQDRLLSTWAVSLGVLMEF